MFSHHRFVTGFVYYGISLNTANLYGNPYVNFIISGVMEMPVYFLINIVCRYWGRVIPYGGSFILGGVVSFAILLVPSGKL